MDKLKLAALLVLLPLGVLAQGFDYSSIYTVTPEEFPAQQRMAAIIGQSAVSIDDETVGDVRDVITDETGTVVGYLVDSGGFLGLGETHVFVPKDQGVVRVDGISVELVIQLEAAVFRTDVRLD